MDCVLELIGISSADIMVDRKRFLSLVLILFLVSDTWTCGQGYIFQKTHLSWRYSEWYKPSTVERFNRKQALDKWRKLDTGDTSLWSVIQSSWGFKKISSRLKIWKSMLNMHDLHWKCTQVFLWTHFRGSLNIAWCWQSVGAMKLYFLFYISICFYPTYSTFAHQLRKLTVCSRVVANSFVRKESYEKENKHFQELLVLPLERTLFMHTCTIHTKSTQLRKMMSSKKEKIIRYLQLQTCRYTVWQDTWKENSGWG